jgi:hypothetical protein
VSYTKNDIKINLKAEFAYRNRFFPAIGQKTEVFLGKTNK